VCENCADEAGGTSRQRVPEEVVKEWEERKDPRATCEFCGSERTVYLVEGDGDNFNPDLLAKHNIRGG